MKKCASILALFGIFQCTYCFYPRYSRCLSSGIQFSRDSIAITIGQCTPRFQNKCNRNFRLNRKGFPFESFRSKIDPSDVFGNARFMNSTEVREALRSPLVELGLGFIWLSTVCVANSALGSSHCISACVGGGCNIWGICYRIYCSMVQPKFSSVLYLED